jgi:beta-glucosidase
MGPAVDMARVAVNGHAGDSISREDPVFAKSMAVTDVNSTRCVGVLSTMKHFILNNQEANRNFYNSVADQRSLWEVGVRFLRVWWRS